MIENYQTAVEHYSWVAYEAAVMAYGIDSDQAWNALEQWTLIAMPLP